LVNGSHQDESRAAAANKRLRERLDVVIEAAK
jgi:hypothetical protein